MHLEALEKMGAEIKVESGYITAKSKRLKGANIIFDNKISYRNRKYYYGCTLAKGTNKD
jgi:UDP-N-acetylglucosamine 1-carboxyvinyltransferase